MTDFKWTERKVAKALCRVWNWSDNVMLPNYADGLTGFEADLVIVRPSGWAEEVEIKVSVADFRSEFREKPKKHRILQEGHPKWHYKPITTENPQAVDEWLKVLAKPEFIPGETGYRDEIICGDDWSDTTPHKCRRYWFAMPEELAGKLESEIPEYAGLIAVDCNPIFEAYSARVVKQAPNLKNSEKVDDAKRAHILKCAYYRFWQNKPLREAE